MGPEPLIEAMKQGAQVVISGRTTDTAIYAAVPIMKGLDSGATWHASKLLECGAACVAAHLPRLHDGVDTGGLGQRGAAQPQDALHPGELPSPLALRELGPLRHVEPGRVLHMENSPIPPRATGAL
jgi:hypothetical protein